MILLVKLFLAHIIGDFILQPSSWVTDKEHKKHKSIYLYIHTALHAVLAIILVGEIEFIKFALILTVAHGIIDYAKLRFQKKKTKRSWFLIDQVVHIIVIIGIALLYTNQTLALAPINNSIWIFITGIIFLTKPTSILIKNTISIWTPENKSKHDNSLSNAGNYIGILERLFVFTFIVTGHFEAIGFLLAAKSIFRFGDLKEAKDRKLTEYVLIGTLLSFGIALITGLLAQAIPF
jgi:hypothetical protein